MTSTSTTRASLLRRVRDPGDSTAWKELDRRYGPLVLAYCHARGWQPSDAEDIRQMVMAKLAQSLRAFEYRPEAGGFRRYLRTVVRGEIARYAARHGPGVRPVPLEDGLVESTANLSEPDSAWEREWMRHHFRVAWATVQQSSEESSLEVFRQLLAGVSPAGIAQSMSMTEAAVRKIKQRIGDRLKAAIAEQILDEDRETFRHSR